MNLAAGSTISLTPAPPGWTVTLDWRGDKEEVETCPLVAWAVVVTTPQHKGGLPGAEPQPAFVYDGSIYTESELRATIGNAVLEICPPPAEWVSP